jgi:hypothetical protein
LITHRGACRPVVSWRLISSAVGVCGPEHGGTQRILLGPAPQHLRHCKLAIPSVSSRCSLVPSVNALRPSATPVGSSFRALPFELFWITSHLRPLVTARVAGFVGAKMQGIWLTRRVPGRQNVQEHGFPRPRQRADAAWPTSTLVPRICNRLANGWTCRIVAVFGEVERKKLLEKRMVKSAGFHRSLGIVNTDTLLRMAARRACR